MSAHNDPQPHAHGAPQTPETPPAQALAIIAATAGGLSLFLFAVILAPLAVILGSVAVAKGNKTGWVGVVVGGVNFAVIVTYLARLLALSSQGY